MSLEDHAPRLGRLVGVAGPQHRQLRDRPQRRQVLDRLVGRPVLAERRPSRACRPTRRCSPHQRARAGSSRACSRRTAGTSTRTGARSRRGRAMPLTIRAHAVLAHAEEDVAPRPLAREVLRVAARELGLRRLAEVGRAADHRRHEVGERGHRLLPGDARRELVLARPVDRRAAPAPARQRPAGPRPRPTRQRDRRRRRATTQSAPTTPPAASAPRARWSIARSDLVGHRKCASGSQPSASFASRTSSSPSGAPWALHVPSCSAPGSR